MQYGLFDVLERDREETDIQVGGKINHYINRNLEAGLEMRYQDRDSDNDNFDFDRYTAMITLKGKL